MFRNFLSLTITVLVGTMVLIAWTPTAKSGIPLPPDCASYCESAFICACASKFGGNLRETKCEFRGAQSCMAIGEEYGYDYCNCDPDPKCFSWKEKDEVWLRYPDFLENPCPPT